MILFVELFFNFTKCVKGAGTRHIRQPTSSALNNQAVLIGSSIWLTRVRIPHISVAVDVRHKLTIKGTPLAFRLFVSSINKEPRLIYNREY